MFLVSCLYGLILLISSERLYIRQSDNYFVPNNAYIKGLLISIAPLFAFYKFGINGVLNEKKVKTSIIFLIFITIAQYYSNFVSLFIEFGGIFVNNYAYSFVLLMPFSFFLADKKWVKYLFLLFCFGFVLFGAKKGAIFTGMLCMLYCLWNDMNTISVFKKTLTLILSVLAFLFFIYVFSLYMNDAWDLVVTRMELLGDGNMSHRDLLYSTFWDHFLYKSDFVEQLLGHGAYATLKVYDNFAHNDWLEFLIDQGLLSVLIYAIYFVSFYRYVTKKLHNNKFSAALKMIFIILFARTLFSMSFCENTIALNIMLGYLFAIKGKQLQKI